MKARRRILGNWRTLTTLVILSFFYFQLVPRPEIPDYLKHLLLALLAVTIIHLADRLFLLGEFLRQVLRSQRHAERAFDVKLDIVTTAATRAINEAVDRSTDLLKQMRLAGLTNIYPSRNHAAGDILAAVAGASSDVWLLGVAFHKPPSLDDVLAYLPKEKPPHLRVLLLDALRSPALFRTVLEADGTKARRIFEDPPNEANSYFKQTLYSQFHHSVITVDNNAILKDKTRFYAHDPSLWMVLVDEEVFFEPYTFGKPSELQHRENLLLGGHMPVFRFRKGEAADAYSTLRDHFHKLWLISDADLFHVGARDEDLERILTALLERRKDALRRVVGVLYPTAARKAKNDLSGEPDAKDPRRCPRRACETQTPIGLRWGVNGAKRELIGKVEVSAYDMIQLCTVQDPDKPPAEMPPDNETVELFDPSTGTAPNRSSQAMMRALLREPREFRVVRVPDDSFRSLVVHGRSPEHWPAGSATGASAGKTQEILAS